MSVYPKPSEFAYLPNLDTRLSNVADNPIVLAVSYTTPLPAGAEVLTAFAAKGYARIVGSCYSDVSGTLYIEQSPDGSNWDVSDSFSYTGGTRLKFSVEVVCPYARFRYVNGAANQTVFRLYVFLRRYS